MKRIHIYLLTAMALLNSSCSADWLDLNTTSSVETGQAIVTLDDAQICLLYTSDAADDGIPV